MACASGWRVGTTMNEQSGVSRDTQRLTAGNISASAITAAVSHATRRQSAVTGPRRSTVTDPPRAQTVLAHSATAAAGSVSGAGGGAVGAPPTRPIRLRSQNSMSQAGGRG